MYQWKPGSRIKLDADVAGCVCKELEESGGLTPQRLVDASRPVDSPLHGYFDWDDKSAAEKYREVQAGKIIRSLEVVYKGQSEPIRAYVPVTLKEERSYVSINKAIRVRSARDELINQAYKDARAFIWKYGQLTEITGVTNALRGLLEGRTDD